MKTNNIERRFIDHYAAVRARCYGRSPVPKRALPVVKPIWTDTEPDGFVPPKREAWQNIVYEVCAKHGICYADMMQRSRVRPRSVDTATHTHARWECWYRIRHELAVNSRRPNMAEIAHWFGLADHSSISYGLHQFAVILKRQGNDQL